MDNSSLVDITGRGLLELSVELSTRDITAGNQFSLFVLVKNPFDKPVWIRKVHVSLPSEIQLSTVGRSHDMKQGGLKRLLNLFLSKKLQKRRLASKSKLSDKQLLRHKDWIEHQNERFESTINDLILYFEEFKDPLSMDPFELLKLNDDDLRELRESPDLERNIIKISSSFNAIRERLSIFDEKKTAHNINLKNSFIDTLEIQDSLSNITLTSDGTVDKPAFIDKLRIQDSSYVAQEFEKTRTIELESSLPRNTGLPSASTAVFTAVLAVKKSFFFAPSKYRLQFNVNYSFDPPTRTKNNIGEQNVRLQEYEQSDQVLFTNTIAHEISIRPSIYSIIWGASGGGFIGAIARLLQINPSITWISFTQTDFLVAIALSIILSGIAVIFMARKSDAQSFVSIEDFWGGLLIGFLIGYTGTSFFSELTGIESPTAPN